MNAHLSPADIASAVEAFESELVAALAGLAPVAPPRVRHAEPFSKRAEGLARRKERRQVRAAKAAWLNS